jgi:hypothetical protein
VVIVVAVVLAADRSCSWVTVAVVVVVAGEVHSNLAVELVLKIASYRWTIKCKIMLFKFCKDKIRTILKNVYLDNQDFLLIN